LLRRISGGFRAFKIIGAIRHDLRDGLAKAGADRFQLRQPALIFDRIMQQGGDRLVLVSPVLERDRGDGKEVRDIGDPAPFAGLGAVKVDASKNLSPFRLWPDSMPLSLSGGDDGGSAGFL
jgi:hypothetical protein